MALKLIRPEQLMRAADVRRFENETRMVEGRDLESRCTEYLDDVRRAARLVPERDCQILDWRLNDVAWPEIAGG